LRMLQGRKSELVGSGRVARGRVPAYGSDRPAEGQQVSKRGPYPESEPFDALILEIVEAREAFLAKTVAAVNELMEAYESLPSRSREAL
jgi:hypothetical protein